MLGVTLLTPGRSAGTVTAITDPVETTIADASDGVTVSVMDTTVDEGETAMLTVDLSGAVDDDVTVDFSLTPGTAADGADKDYSNPSDTSLTIERGETMGMISVQTRDDMLAEASETFTVTITLPDAPRGVTIGNASATVTITDDALTATVVGPTEVEEGSEAEYTVTLTGGGGEAEDVTVTFSTGDSTATAGVDFSPASGSVTIPADEGMATVHDSDPRRRGSGSGRDAGAERGRGDRPRRYGASNPASSGDDRGRRRLRGRVDHGGAAGGARRPVGQLHRGNCRAQYRMPT